MVLKTIGLTKKIMLASAISMIALSPLTSYGQGTTKSGHGSEILNYLENYGKQANIKHQKFDITLKNGERLASYDVTTPSGGQSMVNSVSYFSAENVEIGDLTLETDQFSLLASIAQVANLGELTIIQLDGTKGRQVPGELTEVFLELAQEVKKQNIPMPEGTVFPEMTFVWSEKTGLSLCPATVPVGMSGVEWSAGHLDYLKAVSKSHNAEQLVNLNEKKQLDSPLVNCAAILTQLVYDGLESKKINLADSQVEQLSKIKTAVSSKIQTNIAAQVYYDKKKVNGDVDFPVLSLSDGTVVHGSNSFNVFFYNNESIYQVSIHSLFELFKDYFGTETAFPLAAFMSKPMIGILHGFLDDEEKAEREAGEGEEEPLILSGKKNGFAPKCEAVLSKYRFRHSKDVVKFYVDYAEDKQTLRNNGKRHPDQNIFNKDIEHARACAKTDEWRRRVAGYPSKIKKTTEQAKQSGKDDQPEKTNEKTTKEKKEKLLKLSKPLNEIMGDLETILTPDFFEIIKVAADISAKKVEVDEQEPLDAIDDVDLDYGESVDTDEDSSGGSIFDDLSAFMESQETEFNARLNEKEQLLDEQQAEFEAKTAAQEERLDNQRSALNHRVLSEKSRAENAVRNLLSDRVQEVDDQKAAFEKRLADKDQELDEARQEIEALKEKLKSLEKTNVQHTAELNKIKKLMNSKAR